MKICACIAEYNPFHLGHLKHIDYIKNELKADKVIVLMSGNFTQRGECAVLDKFTRARHAILAGADAVIELPSVFATANAEVFAKGAINLLCSLKIADGLCFGVESGDRQSYLSLATAMNNENKEFKKTLKEYLDSGVSLAKAKFETVKALNGDRFDQNLIATPNNILALEYVKALDKKQSDIQFFPMIREGDHNDKTLKKGITSATSIRNALKMDEIKKIKKCVPSFVYEDLNGYPTDFDKIIMSSIITTPTERLAQVPDCTEGLENRIKALTKDNHTIETLVEKVSTKRYTQARIRRILTANLLGITKDFTDDCLKSDLYLKVLAVKKESKDLISLMAQNSTIPVLTRKSDADELKRTAKKCFLTDVLANDLYNLATNSIQNENYMLII